MDSIVDQEAKLISMNSLQEGEEFERDINNIIEIIDGVEKNMSQQRLTQHFTRTTALSNTRRQLEMSRTLQAQNNHQQNFTVKQNHAIKVTKARTRKMIKDAQKSPHPLSMPGGVDGIESQRFNS